MASRKKKKNNVHVFVVLIVVAALLTAAFLTENRPSKEHADLEQYFAAEPGRLAVVKDDVLSRKDALIRDGSAYVSLSCLGELNARFFFDESEDLLLFTLPDGTLTADGSALCGDRTVLLKENGQTYVLLDYVGKYTDMRWQLFSEPDRLIIRTASGEREVLQAAEETVIRSEARISSPIMTTLKAGQTVSLIEEQSKWYTVCTEDGISGFMQADSAFTRKTVTEEHAYIYPAPEMVSNRQGISLVWHQIRYRDEDNEKLEELMADVMGVTVVSPTWFFLTDGEGNFDNASSAAYVTKAHDMGLEVWALMNNMDNEIYGADLTGLLMSTSRRTKLVSGLVEAAVAIDADGINVDLENVPSDAGRGYVQFIREMSVACHAQGLILSVDNYVPSAWTAHYDRREQGIFADYVIVMGYDEHYAGSDAGSTASLSFVTGGIEKTIEQVPAEKVICGVPFFTRLWRGSGTALTSQTLSMSGVRDFLKEHKLTPEWDGGLGQNYVSFILDGERARIWIEDTESMSARLSALKPYKTAGLAAWRLGMEIPEVWNVMNAYLEGTDVNRQAESKAAGPSSETKNAVTP